MKTSLRSLVFFALLFIPMVKTIAQCTVSNIVIQNVTPINATINSCTVKFDITFNIADNSGNKFIFIHTWLQADYPNYFKCVNGQPTVNGSIKAPGASDLVKSVLNIGLNNLGAKPIALSTYPPAPSVMLAVMDSTTKVVLPDGSANITLYGVVTTAPIACTTPVVVVADLWSSQSANAQRAHCVNCGIRYSAGFLNVFGIVNCITSKYVGTISNNTNIPINGVYEVYADVNNDGYFTPVTDTLLNQETNFAVAGNGTITITGDVSKSNVNQNIFIVITQKSGAATDAKRVVLFISTICFQAPLPVTFLSFNASRSNAFDVQLSWQTSLEINNKGFYIERNVGNGVWTPAGFVASQALNGNANNTLSYVYKDANTTKGITQYRIQQIDLDGRSKYSEIRAVKGDAQNKKTIIYPNPSVNGRVQILFDASTSPRNIILTDVDGKLIKEWKAILGNTLQIENLNKGIYILKVVLGQTGIQTVEKIIVL